MPRNQLTKALMDNAKEVINNSNLMDVIVDKMFPSTRETNEDLQLTKDLLFDPLVQTITSIWKEKHFLPVDDEGKIMYHVTDE